MVQKVTCSGCQATLKAPAAAAGKVLRCPRCKTAIPVPVIYDIPLDAPPAPVPPPTAPPPPADDFAFGTEADTPFSTVDTPAPRLRRTNTHVSAGKAYTYLACGILMLLLGGAMALGGLVTFRTRLQGARAITSRELNEMHDPKTLADPWVVINANKLEETNLGIEETRGRRTKQTRFVLIPVDDCFLVAEVPLDFSGTQIEGKLEVWNAGIGAEALEKIRTTQPDDRDKLLPVQLNATEGSAALGPTIILSGAAIFALVGLGSLFYGWSNLPRQRRGTVR